MSAITYDLAVIGSGGAAMAAGISASRAGARVVLIEKATLGGTCVNIGCVPSKTLLAAAGRRYAAANNPFTGARTHAGPVDFSSLVAQKNDLITSLRQHKYADVLAAHGIELQAGTARFRDAQTLEVDGRQLAAGAYLIATGAEPSRPNLSGVDAVEYLTSTTAMALTELPESLIVVGGGYVGMEQAQLFADLGSHVTLIGRLAPRAEPELREVMRRAFACHGIRVVEHHAAAVQANGHGVTVVTDGGERLNAAKLLAATGRTPRTADLGLAAADVKTDTRGFIVVDQQQRTSNPRVFAAGDVTGAPQFVYVAAATGRVAAINALGGTGTVDYTALPRVIFTRPQLASAGLTEERANQAGHRVAARTLPLDDVPRARVNFDVLGAVKIVADAGSGRVLGVHAAAESAGELMLAATYAIKAGMSVDDLADTWAPYLTMAESLRLAAGLFRDEMPTSCCA